MLYVEGDSPLRYRINRLGGRSKQEKWILQAELFNEIHRWVSADWKKLAEAGDEPNAVDRLYAVVRDFFKAAEKVWGEAWGNGNFMVTKPVTIKAMLRVCADLAHDDAEPVDGRREALGANARAPGREQISDVPQRRLLRALPGQGPGRTRRPHPPRARATGRHRTIARKKREQDAGPLSEIPFPARREFLSRRLAPSRRRHGGGSALDEEFRSSWSASGACAPDVSGDVSSDTLRATSFYVLISTPARRSPLISSGVRSSPTRGLVRATLKGSSSGGTQSAARTSMSWSTPTWAGGRCRTGDAARGRRAEVDQAPGQPQRAGLPESAGRRPGLHAHAYAVKGSGALHPRQAHHARLLDVSLQSAYPTVDQRHLLFPEGSTRDKIRIAVSATECRFGSSGMRDVSASDRLAAASTRSR